jgi:hypothetical protein
MTVSSMMPPLAFVKTLCEVGGRALPQAQRLVSVAGAEVTQAGGNQPQRPRAILQPCYVAHDQLLQEGDGSLALHKVYRWPWFWGDPMVVGQQTEETKLHT